MTVKDRTERGDHTGGAELLRVESITKKFPGVTALNNVSLNLRVGEVHVLLGENGAGKSTLIKCLSGVYEPDEGRIFIDDTPVKLSSTAIAAALGIATIFQEFNLIPDLSVGENILLGRQPRRFGIVNKRESTRLALAAMRRVGLDERDLHVPVSSLGVARQQLVEIAKAISQDARILILDEPTAALTDEEADRLLELMDQLRTVGVGLIFISHHLNEIRRIGDRITVLRDGSTVSTVSAFTEEDELIKLMVGRDIGAQYPRQKEEAGKVLLEVSGLTAEGRFSEINLQVKAGEVVGLAGLVGAGRTEVLRAVFGIDSYDSGSVTVNGRTLKPGDLKGALQAGLGLVPEDRKNQGIVPNASVAENLALVTLPKLSKAGIVDRRALRRQAESTVKELRVRTPSIDQEIRNLSGGNQQKVVMGKWLIADTQVLLLDEPTRGVDVGARVELYQLINRITAAGRGVLMVSSDLPEVVGMCDRILVMAAGRITGELSGTDASQDAVMALAVKKVESSRVH